MTQIVSILLFFAVSLFSFGFSISNYLYFAPQLIAIVSIFILTIYFLKKRISLHLVALLINIIIFATGGLNSSFFFLIYFFLFIIAFQNPSSSTLAYSLFLVLILSQSLNSFNSVITLSSLLLITPLARFIGNQVVETRKNEKIIIDDETDVLLWHSLKLKTGLYQIIDSASEILSSPLTQTQKEQTKKIKESAKSLLSSSEKLTEKIDNESDD